MNGNPSLQTVSLCGCFSSGDPMIDSFADTIAENVSVTKLLIRGIGVNILADSVSTVLAGVCRNKHIQNIHFFEILHTVSLLPEEKISFLDNIELNHNMNKLLIDILIKDNLRSIYSIKLSQQFFCEKLF